MIIKFIIGALFVAMVASLFTSFTFLRKDFDEPSSKRTLYALGVRVTIAVALLATIAFGFYSGKLKSKAPWDYGELITPQQAK
ncbi:DUF2909 domain-containing protein [Saccharophagus degradans]|uniref:DUF2909 domain-containing protein n=1 Tax=Saccharophagus degradans TaxID=86304 RepID=A0AAW7X575_9GAMM|nr:DUF2909 domain-containing protein [Saccharophagus degradans]MDO6422717.1 DUF2909 domain-containing protein [Saccharophagus degradans]MDO6606190.1 DUF2909 domain-containing protein [Saccharophagus degradans]WGO98514.1 DUF2909 domain-containing protein [Saccharophagus degradans]